MQPFESCPDLACRIVRAAQQKIPLVPAQLGEITRYSSWRWGADMVPDAMGDYWRIADVEAALRACGAATPISADLPTDVDTLRRLRDRVDTALDEKYTHKVVEPPVSATLDDQFNAIEGEWAIKAVEYARAQVVPRYGPDDVPTPYEKGLINRLAATYRDGYLAAFAALRARGAAERSPAPMEPSLKEQQLDWVLACTERLLREEHGKDAAYTITEAWRLLPPELMDKGTTITISESTTNTALPSPPSAGSTEIK